MSKYFGWLKKNKKKDESPSEPQQGLQPDQPAEPLSQEPPVEVAQSDAVSSISEMNKATPVPTVDIESSVPPASEQATPEANPDIKLETEIKAEAEGDIIIEAEISPESEAIVNKNESDLGQEQSEAGFFSKLKRGLSRTKENLGSGFVSLFRGKTIDEELFEELETQLLLADVGVDTTNKIIKHLTETADRKQLKDAEALYQLLKNQMTDILSHVDKPLKPHKETGPFVILMVGVNGVGKTTTIGKMAKQFQQQGKKVMLAAGDTFRAAAVEQLQVWGERNNIPVVAQQTGSDSASVLFDALQSAQARNIDVLIADTAGRLQNKAHLMEELKKVLRVMKKINPDAPHEIMLTLDAGTGQNAVSQTKLFHQAVGLTGLCLTKLDGTAKGGVIFAIADQFSIPIRYIGVGEGIDDLRPFNSHTFVEALFSENQPGADKLSSPATFSKN